jgi:GrpB-like predicted nucleotidyltransferase (UPF0157 family)
VNLSKSPHSYATALGELALRIDHIGSTSIPGLDAKDIIDIQLTVSSFDDFQPVQSALEEIGFALKPDYDRDHRPPGAQGPDSDWEKRYFQPTQGQRPIHLHVRAAGRPNQRYPLLFRDYLRAHPAAAAGYASLKRVLAQLPWEQRRSHPLRGDQRPGLRHHHGGCIRVGGAGRLAARAFGCLNSGYNKWITGGKC